MIVYLISNPYENMKTPEIKIPGRVLGLALLGLAAFGCRPPEANGTGGEGGGDRNVATELLFPTATLTPEQTATSTPEPTATPKTELKFPSNGVFAGKNIVVIYKPNGQVVSSVNVPEAICSDRSKALGFLTQPFLAGPSSFNYRKEDGSQIVTGNLIDAKTLIGTVGNDAYTRSYASGEERTCPANLVDWRASYVANGSDTFKAELAKLLGYATLPAPLERTIDGYLR